MDANAQLNPQARLALERVSRLEVITKENISRKWELEYQCNDLKDKIRRLEAQLRDSIPLSDPNNMNPAMIPATALEISLQHKIAELGSKIKKVEQRLGVEISQNWELTYQCEDQKEEISRLRNQLRKYIQVDDTEFTFLSSPTALEKLLEERIRELEGGIRYRTGRTRSKSF
ncbi:hypothetical protein QC761_704030 [Podospora bellae-mahoneyi]|uniref:Uncharacterized protein n=1 Tax=Podospora bellae-mahoneyi TaxID=2093777 RepID=A0ABR0F5L4_9PEZI|nr:hypothetical protein QC761_704030 [Podospora bellae-mahoneyi]